mmetsp:Transcript_1284/g.4058  ORF Transcript_1284/g.4058 Transcript_1284/m.4058 type:complete len:269 (+) Transcript_1284:1136-1942(+)
MHTHQRTCRPLFELLLILKHGQLLWPPEIPPIQEPTEGKCGEHQQHNNDDDNRIGRVVERRLLEVRDVHNHRPNAVSSPHDNPWCRARHVRSLAVPFNRDLDEHAASRHIVGRRQVGERHRQWHQLTVDQVPVVQHDLLFIGRLCQPPEVHRRRHHPQVHRVRVQEAIVRLAHCVREGAFCAVQALPRVSIPAVARRRISARCTFFRADDAVDVRVRQARAVATDHDGRCAGAGPGTAIIGRQAECPGVLGLRREGTPDSKRKLDGPC